jgi:hypothetical protein
MFNYIFLPLCNPEGEELGREGDGNAIRKPNVFLHDKKHGVGVTCSPTVNYMAVH